MKRDKAVDYAEARASYARVWVELYETKSGVSKYIDMLADQTPEGLVFRAIEKELQHEKDD